MKFGASFSGVASPYVRKLSIGATVVAGQIAMWAGASGIGDITDPTSTTSCADATGFTLEAGTHSTVQGSAGVEVMTVVEPQCIIQAVACGGAGSTTALGTSSPANIITNTSASAGGTTVTAAEVGTIDMTGGILIGLTGANRGAKRTIAAHTNNTSTGVTKPFDRAIAVGDKFVRLPWRYGIKNVQLTTDFTEANAIIATGTGIAVRVVDAFLTKDDRSAPEAAVQFLLGDHIFNPLAA